MTRAKYVEIGVQRGLSAALRDSRGVDPQVFQFPRAPSPRQNNFKQPRACPLLIYTVQVHSNHNHGVDEPARDDLLQD